MTNEQESFFSKITNFPARSIPAEVTESQLEVPKEIAVTIQNEFTDRFIPKLFHEVINYERFQSVEY